MGVIYLPPTKVSVDDQINQMVFLAGSIEMDKAENWQEKLGNKLRQIERLTILNPRRKNWDSNWEQKITNAKFKEQVDWELDGIDTCDTVIFYFDPNTKSPITLMELGIVSAASEDKNVIVCCPEGFWRKGNVDILVSRMSKRIQNVISCNNLTELITKSYEFLEANDYDKWKS